jgi:putative FmdB family regulatory protein
MARYDHRCPTHGVFELVMKMAEAGEVKPCPDCGAPSKRVYHPVLDVWHTDGAFKTDHINDGRPGDKRERLNKAWEQAGWGKPPPPAPEVPRSGGEKY